MRRVVIESPYGSPSPATVQRNVAYARACMQDCFKRNEAPFASHLLYTQEGVLNDQILEERNLGIEAGLLWVKSADATVAYKDLGITPGMQKGIDRAYSENRTVEYRKLPKDSWFWGKYEFFVST